MKRDLMSKSNSAKRRIQAVCAAVALLVGAACDAAPTDGPIEGYFAQLPLGDVAQEMAPQGVTVELATGVDPAQKVTWQGGGSWQQAMQAAIEPLHLVVAYSGDAVVIQPKPLPKWDVIEGETVAQTVVRWSKQAGYTPVPHFAAAERWRIFVSQTKQGSFDDALEWLSKGFNLQPTKPVFYLGENHTIDILSRETGMTPADAGQGRF